LGLVEIAVGIALGFEKPIDATSTAPGLDLVTVVGACLVLVGGVTLFIALRGVGPDASAA
jgi:hypothetical protein